MAVAASGEIFSWGDGENGKLGHGSTDRVRKPKIISSLMKPSMFSSRVLPFGLSWQGTQSLDKHVGDCDDNLSKRLIFNQDFLAKRDRHQALHAEPKGVLPCLRVELEHHGDRVLDGVKVVKGVGLLQGPIVQHVYEQLDVDAMRVEKTEPVFNFKLKET